MKTIVALIVFAFSLFAAGDGELSFYLLKDGKPMSKQTVEIYAQSEGKNTLATTIVSDADGFAGASLPEGSYQLQVLAKDGTTPLAFARKNFLIKAGKESQIILALDKSNAFSFSDSEAPKAKEKASAKVANVQSGFVTLILSSSEDNKPVVGAKVFVRGQDIELVSDAKGQVTIKAPATEQTLSVIHSDFSAQTLPILFVANETLTKAISLTPAAMELEEFVVLAPNVEGSIASVMAEERTSDAVGNVLGSEQFSKSGDSDAASALKRVSGITIVGGKYVYVRGLGDRYSTILLNGLDIPSPEPTKRVVPLDTFPTSIIGSMLIQKSYTADLPASFGGGTVLIRTKDIPKDEGYIKASMTFYSNNSTGKESIYNADNTTPIPPSIIAASDNFQEIVGEPYSTTVKSSRSLNLAQSNVPFGGKVELSAGKTVELSNDFSLGASGSFYFQQKSDNDQVDYSKYIYDFNTESVLLDSTIQSDVRSDTQLYGGMVNIGFKYFDNQTIKYSLFTNTNIQNNTTFSKVDYTGSAEDRDKTYLEYIEQELLIHQITGSNEITFSSDTEGYFDNIVFDWGVENASANRLEPGTVEYNYRHTLTDGLIWDQKNWYYYSKLEDTVQNYRADVTLPFVLNDNDNYTQFGMFIFNKERDFDARRFNLRDTGASSTSINLSNSMDTIYSSLESSSLQFASAYQAADSYRATQNITALYLKQLISVTQDLDIVASMRQESSTQHLFDVKTGDGYNPLETSDMFPSLGLTYRVNEDSQLRASYASSITRPDFREFSPNRYVDPITENIIFGNPDLQATYIDHLDLKYEWYFSSDEMLAVALFAKTFTNPVETVVRRDDSQGNVLQQTYKNAKSATSNGIEINYRQRFGFVDNSLNSLLLSSNFSLINSEVEIQDDPNDIFLSRLTTTKRAMQGQSPYVINLQFGYDNPDTGDSALFLFNQIGERIVLLGTDMNEDQYQEPFAKLDFATRWKLNNYFLMDSDFTYEFKFKASNILDSEMKITQGDNTTVSTKPGRDFSLSLSITY